MVPGRSCRTIGRVCNLRHTFDNVEWSSEIDLEIVVLDETTLPRRMTAGFLRTPADRAPAPGVDLGAPDGGRVSTSTSTS